MRRFFPLAINVVLAIGATRATTFAQEPAGAPSDLVHGSVVQLHNGPNNVDINGDGRTDVVFVGWRENFNAHGYNSVTFYLSRGEGVNSRWDLVPFFDAQGHWQFDSFRTEQGADCVLSDLRMFRIGGKSAPVTVVVAKRDLGNSYADSAGVTFTVYGLKRNVQQLVGWPEEYLEAEGTSRSRREYCDVENAFALELKPGSDPNGQGDSP